MTCLILQNDTNRLETHPCPILTRLRYSRVGSASVQICCSRFTISNSLSLPFFSLRRGVATPAAEFDALAKLAAAGLCGCSCFAVRGSRSLCLGSPPTDALGACFVGALGAGPEATSPDAWAGVRLFCVVFERPKESEDFVNFCGVRWDVDRSRVGVRTGGGAGAGRYAVGPGDTGGIDVFEMGGRGLKGGGGAARCQPCHVSNWRETADTVDSPDSGTRSLL